MLTVPSVQRRSWLAWLSAGIDEFTPDETARRLRLINGFSVLIAVLTLAGTPFDWELIGERALYINLTVAVLYLAIPLASSLGLERLARVGFILISLMALASYQIILGSTSGIQFLCFPALGLPALFLTSKERGLFVVLCILPGLIFMCAESGVLDLGKVHLIGNTHRFVYWWNSGVAFALSTLILMYLRYIQDHDYRKLLEQQAELAQAARMSAVGRLASGIAHEINNPLTIILAKTMQAREVLEKNGDRVQVLAHLELVTSMVDRITRIIKGLTSIARGSGGNAKTEVLAADVIDKTLDLCREDFIKHGISLDIVMESEDLILNANATEVSQILANLLSNAFDAVKREKERWIRIGCFKREPCIVISVTDSGPGVPEPYREHVFDPFFTMKSIGEGIGLGLSISRSLAISNNGKLEYDSRALNTTFVLTLPAR